MNVGSETSKNDQFSCFAKSGLTGENYFEFPIINVILPYIDPIRDEVCERPTPSPTSPTSPPTKGGTRWTKSPTPKQTLVTVVAFMLLYFVSL